jgi:hypothetical protein
LNLVFVDSSPPIDKIVSSPFEYLLCPFVVYFVVPSTALKDLSGDSKLRLFGEPPTELPKLTETYDSKDSCILSFLIENLNGSLFES